MKTYGQYCPIARASEIFAERWTPIIIRNLLAGCQAFSELLAGAPGIPKTLLKQRLELLEQSGIIERSPSPRGRGFLYRLTAKGEDLRSVCDTLGTWGARWLEIKPQHIEPGYVLWATSKLVDVQKLPHAKVIVRVDLRDQPRRKFWLILQRPRPEVCASYPGTPEDLILTADSETLVNWHYRRISYGEAVQQGLICIDGPPRLASAFPSWVRASPFAHVAPKTPLRPGSVAKLPKGESGH
ncbi:MAG: winged helix-turn-helix transcriptional regulator [Armatimonadota bacterium]